MAENSFEFDLDDLGIESFDELNEIDASDREHYSQSLVEISLAYLRDIQNEYIRLLGFNSVLSKVINESIRSEKLKQDKDNEKYALNNAETDTAAYKSCFEPIATLLSKVKASISYIKEFSELGYQTSYDKLIKVQDITRVAGVIPVRLGKSRFASLVSELNQHYFTDEVPSLEYLKKVEQLAETILYHCKVEQVTATDTDMPALISGSSVKPFDDRKRVKSTDGLDKEENFVIFDVKHRLKQLSTIIQSLKEHESNLDPTDERMPNVYGIEDVTEYTNPLTGKSYVSVKGSIYLSTNQNIEEEKVIHLPTGFSAYMHLIGICNVQVGQQNETTLVNLTSLFSKSIAGVYEAEYKEPEHLDYITVPYCLIGEEPDGRPYIMIGLNDSVASITQMENTAIEGGMTLKEFVLESANRRTSVSHHAGAKRIWYTTVTSGKVTTPKLVSAVTKDYRGTSPTRFTENELYSIAKGKNVLDCLKNYDLSGYAVDSKDAPLLARFSKASNGLITSYKNFLSSVLSTSTKSVDSQKISFGHTTCLTPVRNFLIQTLTSKFEGPLNSTFDVYKLYEKHKKSIQDSVVKFIFSRVEYERDNIGYLFGPEIDDDNYIDKYIIGGRFLNDKAFNISLPVSSISDIFWFMIQIHALGIEVQDFKDDKILKLTENGDGNIEHVKLSREEFVTEVINYFKSEKSLLELWGLAPITKGMEVLRTSKLYSLVIIYLAEAYEVFNILSKSDQLQEFSTDYEVNEEEERIEEMKQERYQYNVDMSSKGIPHVGYEEVKDLLPEDYYNQYKQYLNAVVINPLLTESSKIKTNFDSGMIVNAYIQYLNSIKTEDQDLRTLLLMDVSPVAEDEDDLELSEEYRSIIDGVNNLVDTDSCIDYLIEHTIPKCYKEMDEASKTVLRDLVGSVIQVQLISVEPMVTLISLLKVNEKEGIKAFTTKDVEMFKVSLGRAAFGKEVVIPDTYNNLEYSMDAIQQNLYSGTTLYAARDKELLREVIKSTKFSSIVRQFSKAVTEEEWDAVYQAIQNVIVSKLPKNVDRKIDIVKENIEAYLKSIKLDTLKIDGVSGKDLVMRPILSYTELFLPTDYDRFKVLNSISNILSNVINFKSKELDITKLDDDKLTADEIKKLNDRINLATAFNDIVMAIYTFVPTEIIEEAVKMKEECAEYITQNSTLESSLLERERKSKKSIALFTKVLLTGEEAYLKEVDYDLLPFELLTAEVDNVNHFKICGPYSKSRLISDHGLAVEQGEDNIEKQYLKKPYMELIQMIIDALPDYLSTCPEAIRRYVSKQQKMSKCD